MERIIWQPDFRPKNNIVFYLNIFFARQLINKNLPLQQQSTLNKFASLYLKSLDEKCVKPYTFYEDSGLIIRLDLGRENIAMLADTFDIKKLINGGQNSKPIEYNSISTNTPADAYNLMALFNLWIKYANAQIIRTRTQNA